MHPETPSTNRPADAEPTPAAAPTPTDAPAADSAPRPGRQANGRFAPGNKGGPGNPFGRRVAALRQAFCDAVQPHELQAILRLFAVKAIEGDQAAAKLVLSYVLGQPGAAGDPDRLDLDEWRQHLTNPVTADALEKVCSALPHSAALALLRLLGPAVAQKEVAPVVPPHGDLGDPPGAPSTNGGPTADPSTAAPSTNGPPEAQATPQAPSPNRPTDRPPGNPFARRQALFRAALLDAVSADDVANIARRLHDDAAQGDLRAARLLFRYVVGNAPSAVDPDSLDLEEWRLLEKMSVTATGLVKAMQTATHAEGCIIARQMQPEAVQAFLQTAVETAAA